jgi:hypothetical protein
MHRWHVSKASHSQQEEGETHHTVRVEAWKLPLERKPEGIMLPTLVLLCGNAAPPIRLPTTSASPSPADTNSFMRQKKSYGRNAATHAC